MLNGILYHFINDMRKNPVFHLYGEYMIITKIEKQKKNNKRSSVFLDDKFAFGIDDFDLFKLKLKVGIEISNEELENIRNTVIFTAAKEYAVQLTTRSSYTKKTIIEKLKMRDYDDFIIDKTIAFLEEYKLVDDFDYVSKLNNIDLKYKESEFNIIVDNLIINKNDKLSITGKSGQGKTSVINLILGNISTYKGTINIDDYNIKDARLDIGVVSQEIELFNMSITNTSKSLYQINNLKSI